jgi:putative Mn2+ efflux pump MntP
MDAFAVSIAVGISLREVSFRQTFRLSWHFGLFQALMPVIGWNLGLSVRSYIEAYDHWIAFALLFLVGGNMLREAFIPEPEEERIDKDATKGFTMVVLSVATSIDALAVGFSLSMIETSIVLPAIIIGVVALLFTVAGLHMGKRVAGSEKLSCYAEILGGLVLWGIGLKILHEHDALNNLLIWTG